jgi:parvulin-like peptidyl-prolyl isomerase
MSNKKIEKMQKEYSKPLQTRWERQHKVQKWVFFTGIGLIIAVLILVGVGWYFTSYVPLNKTVLTVNGLNYKMVDYIKLLRAAVLVSSDDDIETTASDVLSGMAQTLLIQDGAAKLNITVSDSEVNKALKNAELSSDWAIIEKLTLLRNKLDTDYFEINVPATADQRDIEAMVLESESQALQVRQQLLALSDDANIISTFGSVASSQSVDSYTQTYSGELGMHVQDLFSYMVDTTIPSDFAFANEKGAVSQPQYDVAITKNLGYWIINVVEAGAGDNSGKIHVQAILTADSDAASLVEARLSAGEDFVSVAKIDSQYTGAKSNGGDLGFIDSSTDSMSTAFNTQAFAQTVGTVSAPVKDASASTTGGYWLVRVKDAANDAAISDDDKAALATKAYNEWYSNLTTTATVDYGITQEENTWAMNKVSG